MASVEPSGSRVARLMAVGRVVGWAKAQVPLPLYRGIRLAWHELTGTADRIGLRRMAWRWRLPTEVSHWENWLRSGGRSDTAEFARDPFEFTRRLMPDLPLQQHLQNLLPKELNASAIESSTSVRAL